MITPVEWLKEYNVKYKKSGTDQLEIGCLIKNCPNFQEPQMYINWQTGAWYCHRCGNKGRNLKELEFKAGFVHFQDPVNFTHIYISENDVNIMHNDLLNNRESMSYLFNQRGFTENTIRQFKIGYKKLNNVDVITIPYFDKTQTCVGLKYHFYNQSIKPKYKFELNSKMLLFNINCLNLNDNIYITEGEYDAMTLWQYGIENVVSIPNGAQGLGEWLNDIKQVPKYSIAFDNDSAGEEGALKLADILGRAKCSRIYPRLKDWNEYLQSGLDKLFIEKAINEEVPLFKAPVIEISQYKDSAIEILQEPNKSKGKSTGWRLFDDLFGGIRDGEVTVASGLTGHGKTTFAFALINNLIKQNLNSLIISPEMPEYEILLKLIASHNHKPVTEVEQIETFVDKFKDKIYIADVFGDWTDKNQESLLHQVFDVIEYSVKQYNIKFVLIDHLRLFLDVSSEKERSEIDRFMQRCVRYALNNKVHIWLVVQPRKLMPKQVKVTMNDLKGSGNIPQDANNVLFIHRNTDIKKGSIVEINVAKNRKLGLIGDFVLEFDLKSRANYYETVK